MKNLVLRSALMCSILFSAVAAHADLASIYAAGKLDQVSGTGDVFENLDPGLAGGVELGIELIGIDLWAEAVWMANQQAMYSANLGFDLTFGDDFRVNLGLHTGPILFQMGETESEEFELSGATKTILDEAAQMPELQMAGVMVPSATDIEMSYNQYFGEEASQVESLAVGWNLARIRAQIEYQIFPFGYLGIGGQYGYHVTISGKAASAHAKNLAIDALVQSELEGLPPEIKNPLVAQIKADVGAQEADTSKLNGTNINYGAYFKLEF